MAVDYKQLVLVAYNKGEILTNIDCKPAELFGIIGKLVEALSDASNGQLEYNQILEDLKEVETSEGEK